MALATNLPVGLFIHQNGNFSNVNTTLSEIIGFNNRIDLIGMRFVDFVHPEDRQLITNNLLEKGLPSGKSMVFRILKKCNRSIWVSLQQTEEIFEDHPYSIFSLLDLSILMRNEDSLSKYQSIMDELEDSIAEIDLAGNILFVNAAGCKIWGATMEESIGRNFRSYLDEETAQFVFNAYNKVFKTQTPGKNINYEIIRKDGQRRMVEDSVSLIRNRGGDITGFRAVSRDITLRKEKEKELAEHRTLLQAIFRSVKDAIVTVDHELKVIEANKSAEIICGLDLKTAKGHNFTNCLNQCNTSCLEIIRQTINNKTSIKEYRVECGSKKKHPQIVSVSSSPLLDPTGNFIGAVLVIRDITLIQDLERELRGRHQFQNIIGKSKKMQDIYSLIEDLANIDTTVLITGESGTGKELIAKAVHYTGHRSLHPFITVNCSALAESLLESELFGHVKGAFTGAIVNKPGRFQLADEGTLLLDEIGDISPFIQLKLLRVLQEKEFEQVGDATPHKVNVRIIACTNKNLRRSVRDGEFREDLYYRLKVVEIHLPPLRERVEDIPLLVAHFCKSFKKQFDKDIKGVSDEVLSRFMDYPWPGNIRELEHVIERAFVLCRDNVITFRHLPPEIRNFKSHIIQFDTTFEDRSTGNDQEILSALNRTFWNKTKAAKLLGISRQTLYRKIKEYNILETV